MRIEVLHFKDCPNYRPTVELVRQLTAEFGDRAVIEAVEVRDEADAERLGFLGSPSVRVNGQDVEPEARSLTRFGISCRRYGTAGIPSRELIAAALREGRRR